MKTIYAFADSAYVKHINVLFIDNQQDRMIFSEIF